MGMPLYGIGWLKVASGIVAIGLVIWAYRPLDKTSLSVRPDTPAEAKLRAISQELSIQLRFASLAATRLCPVDGSRLREHQLPENTPASAKMYFREIDARCESARAGSAVLTNIAEGKIVRPDSLFVFWAYVGDQSDDKFDRYLQGPFLHEEDCETSRALFLQTEVGISACRTWNFELRTAKQRDANGFAHSPADR